MPYLRSLIFSLGMISTLFIFTPLSLIVLILRLPFPLRFKIVSGWGRFCIWWLKVTCGVNYEIKGLENLPQTPAIIFAKHESTWETMALQMFLPPHAWILKRELLWVPLFGWGLASLSPIAINRGSGRRAVNQIVDQGIEKLNKGRWVMVFPEGTRMPPGRLKKFGIGGALLAEKSGYPVLPVAHNAGSHWPKRGFVKRPGTIKVIFGRPIPTEGKSAAQINEESEQWMQQAMAEITGQPHEIIGRK